MSCHQKCKNFPNLQPQSDYGKILSDYRYLTMSQRSGLQKLKDQLLFEGRNTASVMTNLKANNDLCLRRLDKYEMPYINQDIYRYTSTYNQKW
ncbi:hypothetical protein TTHERM_000655292 (macronuclear) [Tetrahymena thermophila SB210]|uniref:Uncharacterized protein n=1 Tax=Tetrahymena thermophila (strain SB210) TaxID=312017 RepID=W7X7F7_TETTS|nr:hypothetical protein TTHERM_000655292 [Tetrahymena thermophila SB210]EWS72308.1 hypothetical protein TTHERM_000655292 [Tetrahymena thermophila SB210]|eukprot:XP_012655142.1 hypothetical protein TTHERM_000655292 [Tetrahymena thermophila SB210]